MEFKKAEAVRSITVTDHELSLEVCTEDEEVREQVVKLADKIQATLDHCRSAVNERTPYMITQAKVIIRENRTG